MKGNPTLVIDAANVVGSRPDGWWRDRPGAAARLLSQVAAALRAGALDPPVVVVLEGAAREGAPAGPGEVAGLAVTHAERDGDTAILLEAAALVEAGAGADVVTADRGLRERVTEAGASVLPPRWLLDRL